MTNQPRYLDNSKPETWTTQDFKDLFYGLAKPMWKVYADKPYRAPATFWPGGKPSVYREFIAELNEEGTDYCEADVDDWSEFSCSIVKWENIKCDIR